MKRLGKKPKTSQKRKPKPKPEPKPRSQPAPDDVQEAEGTIDARLSQLA
jgi:hypothetical protein